MSKRTAKNPRTVNAVVVLFLLSLIAAMTAEGVSITEDPSEYPRSVDLFVRGSDGIALHRIPAFAVTLDGTLLAVCESRVDEGDDPPNNIDLVIRRSSDLGRSWTPSEVIVDFPGTEAAGSPSLLVDRDTGKIWLLYTYCPEGTGWSASQPGLDGPTLQLQLICSEDDGATWSGPVHLNPQVKDPAWNVLLSSPGSGLRAPSGRLYFPVSRRSDEAYTHFIYSDDHGQSWHITPPAGRNTNESMGVVLEDGTLMANMRSMDGKHRRIVAVSSDGGRSWGKQTSDSTLIEPECQASLIRYSAVSLGHDKNRLLFCNPASTDREDMTIRLSYDEGKTWPVSKLIWSGPAGYSCLAVLPDGSVGMFYEHGQRHPTDQLAFVRFTLEWLTDCKDSGLMPSSK